jgi:Mrp family chromosome partitioning ATPase
MADKMQKPILGLIENMSEFICPQCGETLKIFGESQGKTVSQQIGIDFLGSLPWDTQLNNLVDKGEVEEYYSATMAAIVEEITAKMEQ